MTPDQFLSLADIRKKCGLRSGDAEQDALLETYRAAAIAKIERTTRRNIRDRSLIVRSPDRGGSNSYLRFFVYDARPIVNDITIRYRAANPQPGFALDGTISIPGKFWHVGNECVRVYNGRDTGAGTMVDNWPDSDSSVPYEVTLPVGISAPAAGESPTGFHAAAASAALMLVREQQEGSALDSIPMGIVDLLLADYIKPAFTAADEIRFEAGIESGAD